MTTTNRTVKENTNVKMSVSKNRLRMEVDLSPWVDGKELPLSGTGKSYTLGTTHGGKELTAEGCEDVVAMVNVWVRKEAYEHKHALLKQREEAKQIQKELKQAKTGDISKVEELEEKVANMESMLSQILDAIKK